ncbi:MAG: lysophospholipid acyltransferase family protein [Bacteroidales bacterium]|nr:lysophospholipid acyltransferase family protein [Bacteroidales bacterium]
MEQERKSFGVVIVEGILGLLARLPLKFHLACGRAVSWLLREVVHYRRDVVMVNLSRSFPELKYKELKALYRKAYDHFGDIIAEAIWFGGCKDAEGRRRLNESRIVDIVNPEVFNRLYDSADNTMVLMSHAGNWELIGGWHSYNHNPDVPLKSDFSEIGVVYKRLKSGLWDRVMRDNRCNSIRDTGFYGYKESSEILRFAVTHRRQKFVYIFLTDQYPYKGATKHDIGMFMNQPTVAMTGGAALANKFSMNVCYLRWTWLERGKYSVEVVPLCDDASQHSPEEIMEKYYAELEKDIKAQPWNYLWTHRRWK